MSTLEEKIAVMQHFANGGKIQCRAINSSDREDWVIAVEPCWHWHTCDYRIKPEPRSVWIKQINGSLTSSFITCAPPPWADSSSYVEFVEKMP